MFPKSECCQTDGTFNFNTDLLQVYRKNGRYCDLSLQSTVDDSKVFIPCHKIVLATASPFFQQELEKHENRRTIYTDDIDEHTLTALIEYIYSGGDISLSSETVFKLFSGAQHFQLQQLQTECMNFIEGLISIPEVINVLNFAQFHSNENLTNACVQFTLEHLQEIKEHGFLDLDAQTVKLLAEQQMKLGLPSPEDILQAVTEWLHKDEESRQGHAFYLIKDMPLTKISLAALRKLLREDTFMRSIQVVYNLYVDAVEEIGRELEELKETKRPASVLDSNAASSHEDGVTKTEAVEAKRSKAPRKKKRSRKQRVIELAIKQALLTIPLSDPRRIPLATETIVNTAAAIGNDQIVQRSMIFFVSGGGTGLMSQNSIISIDLESRQVRTVVQIPCGVFDWKSSLVYFNQKIYCLGRSQVGNMPRCNVTTVFNLETNTWDPNLPGVGQFREGFKAIADEDMLYAIGGSFPVGTSKDAEQISLANANCRNWVNLPPMTFARAEFGVCFSNGCIYVVGGSAWTRFHPVPVLLPYMECYTRSTGCWKTVCQMPTARRGLAVAVHGHFIYAMGGCNGPPEGLNTVEIYDTKLDIWLPGVPMVEKRQFFSAGVFNDYIYAIGGDCLDYPTMERLDVRNQMWEPMGLLPVNGFLHSLAFASRLDRIN